MGGITLTRLVPSTSFSIPGLLLGTVALALMAGALAWRPGVWARAGWAGALLLAAGLTGLSYFHLRYPHWSETSTRPPREVNVTLAVEQVYPPAPSARSLSGYGVIVGATPTEQALVGRRVYFSALRKPSVAPQRAGRYTLRGVVEPLPANPAALSFDDYLANLGIRQKITRAVILTEASPPGWSARFLTRTAARLETILRHGLDRQPGVASLYVAMLLGEKAVLTDEQQNAFMRSGTFHVFSVSGLHVGVIAAAIHAVFSLLRISRRTTIGLTLIILWLYVQVTGANYPALRAFIMIAFLLGSQGLRQPGNGLAALAAAALATLLYDPAQLFSTGFQMSYAVVLALIVMGAPLAAGWLERWHPFALKPRPEWHWVHHRFAEAGRWVIKAVAACWVAFLASLPAGIGYFGLFSPGSLLANLVIIPVSSLAIVGGFLSLLCGLVGLGPWSQLFNSAAAMLIIATEWLLRRGTALPGVYFPAQFREPWMTPTALALLSGLLLLCHAGRWSRRYGGYWPPVVVLTLLLIFGVVFT
jgi:competence protein ComEC